MNRATLLLLLFLAAPLVAQLPSAERMDGATVTSSFSKADKAAAQCTVRIESGDQFLCLGTVINADGLILTKRSELKEPIKIVVPNKSTNDARIIAFDSKTDLALLKSDYKPTAVARLAVTSKLQLGQWVIGASGRSVRVGVLSATPRAIERSGGVLGIILGNDGKEAGGVTVSQVMKDGPAEKAGLRVNDIVQKVAGKEVLSREDLQNEIRKLDPGQKVTVICLRGEETKTIEVILGHRSSVFSVFEKNILMSGRTSQRKAGFDRVLQHDINLLVTDMGGALFSTDGQIVGINIAKVNRVEFFAIPIEDIHRLLKEHSAAISKASLPVAAPPKSN